MWLSILNRLGQRPLTPFVQGMLCKCLSHCLIIRLVRVDHLTGPWMTIQCWSLDWSWLFSWLSTNQLINHPLITGALLIMSDDHILLSAWLHHMVQSGASIDDWACAWAQTSTSPGYIRPGKSADESPDESPLTVSSVESYTFAHLSQLTRLASLAPPNPVGCSQYSYIAIALEPVQSQAWVW